MSQPKPESIEDHKERLIREGAEEVVTFREFVLPIYLELQPLLCMVGNLQLALRHPANTGPSARIVRKIVDQIIERVPEEGLIATAELLRLGDNLKYDEDRTGGRHEQS